MDKYNANEIINEVKKRAIVASQQRIQNQQIDLKEFHPTTDRDLIQNRYLVSVSNEYNNNLDFFSISLDSIPENVCNALLNMDWTLPVEIKIEDVIVTDNTTCPTETDTSILFAFHNLLNPDAVPTDPACENITCPVGTTCLKGKCLCPDGYEQCAGRCCQDGTICSTNGSDGTCIQADGCTRNEDCKDNDGNRDTGKYCNITTTYNEAEPSCYENYIGRCVNKGSLPSPINIPGLGATWRGGYMTWWSAKNWCLSHGKRLIELDDFECARLSGEHLGYCCNSDHPVCTADKSTLSIIMHHFSEAYSGGPTCWTGTDYGSCFVYDFAVDGRFAHGRRSYNGSVPLCVNP